VVTAETKQRWCAIDTNHGFLCGAAVTHEVVLPGGSGYYSCRQHLGKAVDKLLAGGMDHVKVRKHNPS
jgi:hypothetical protein